MAEKDAVQPDPTDNIQPDDQDKDKSKVEEDDFEPKLSAKEYAEKWRSASAEAAKSRKELAALKAEKDKAEQERLKEQGQYKEMYEKMKGKYEGLEGKLKNTSKSVAFRREAKKNGCHDDLLDALEKLADLDKIELDESFKPHQDQVEFMVKEMREQYGPHFFKKEAPKINDGEPKKTAVEKKLTREEWLKLPLAEQKKRMSEVYKAETEG